MVGNVWEWIDTVCDPPPDAGADAADAGLHASELCSARGGSFANPGGVTPNNLNCKVNARVPRGRQFNDVGFRCCSQ
jgi:formylglycine-generating enzyme required for sulfatase activity